VELQWSSTRYSLRIIPGERRFAMLSGGEQTKLALAMTLAQHQLDFKDVGSHSTLTSLYGILAMARTHNQNPRTYAEIMATGGDGRKIVRSFSKNLAKLMDLAENSRISELCTIMEENRRHMPQSFLQSRMKQAKAVDEILSDPGMKNEN